MSLESRQALFRAVLVFAVAAIFLTPIAWMVGTSFKPPIEFVGTGIQILPDAPTWEHYHALAENDVWRRVVNSIVVSLGATALALLAAFPAAYALARIGLPHHLDRVFLVFVLIVKLAPPIVLAIPLYHVLRVLGLLDTLAGLILVHQVYALPFAIWMLLGFVRDVPIAYEEAAIMDGAGLIRRLRSIVGPIMLPGLVSTAAFVMILSWNEFLYALLFIQTPSKFTLPTFIATMITEDETLWGQLMAIGLVASLPILVLVGVMQKGLTRSFAAGLK